MTLTTRAAVLSDMGAARPYADSRPLSVQTVTLDPPGPGEVLVRLATSGVTPSSMSTATASSAVAGRGRCRSWKRTHSGSSQARGCSANISTTTPRRAAAVNAASSGAAKRGRGLGALGRSP